MPAFPIYHQTLEFVQMHVWDPGSERGILSTLGVRYTPGLGRFGNTFPASGTLILSQLLPSVVQNIGASTSASVLLMNIQD